MSEDRGAGRRRPLVFMRCSNCSCGAVVSNGYMREGVHVVSRCRSVLLVLSTCGGRLLGSISLFGGCVGLGCACGCFISSGLARVLPFRQELCGKLLGGNIVNSGPFVGKDGSFFCLLGGSRLLPRGRASISGRAICSLGKVRQGCLFMGGLLGITFGLFNCRGCMLFVGTVEICSHGRGRVFLVGGWCIRSVLFAVV